MAAQRKIYLEAIPKQNQPIHLPNQQPDAPRVVQRREKVKSKSGLHMIYTMSAICGIGLFGIMFTRLFVNTQINYIHYQIQISQRAITTQSAINEQLNAQIAELSQHSRIMGIANERGLEFNPENVITIEIGR